MMTIFRRDGHFRISKNGVQHWVSGTTVDRDDWNRGYYGHSPTTPTHRASDPFLEKYPEFSSRRRFAACFISPNAKCPVCGDPVFYYQNELGSRVFFDEPWPPWPKHRCTDTRMSSVPLAGVQLGLTFEVRSAAAIAEIRSWHFNRGIRLEAAFQTQYGVRPWSLATIVKRIPSRATSFLIVKLLKQGRSAKAYLSCKSLPKCCQTGCLIAVGQRKISFFETAQMTPVEVLVKKYRGASAFLDALIEVDTGNRGKTP